MLESTVHTEIRNGTGIATLKPRMKYGIRNRNTKTRNRMEFPEYLGIVLNDHYYIVVSLRCEGTCVARQLRSGSSAWFSAVSRRVVTVLLPC